MASAAGLRPNHYELLGLSPTASQDEITRAFAKAMSLFGARSMAAAAQMSLAFEVLRNPAKRREYDRAMGLVREPEPLPRQWTVTASVRSSPGFIGSAWADLARQVVGDAPAAAEAASQAGNAPKLASFIASSLREPSTASEPARREERTGHAIERRLEQMVAARVAEEESAAEPDDRPFEWKRPALAVGGLIVAAGLIGTLAGVSVTNTETPAQAGDGVTVAVPAARAQAKAPPVVADGDTFVPQVPQPVEARSVAAAARHPVVQVPRMAAAAQQDAPDQTVASADPETQPAEASADPLAPAPAAAATVAAAAMPLPNRLIARTIERIGYSCGEVSSTDAVDGASGVFKVTCSSGQTYQASPIHGRYHFRRLGSH